MDEVLGDAAATVGIKKSCLQQAAPPAAAAQAQAPLKLQQSSHSLAKLQRGAGTSHLCGSNPLLRSTGSGGRTFARNAGRSSLFWSARTTKG